MRSALNSRTENTRVWFASRYEHFDTGSSASGNRGCLALIAAVLLVLAGSGLVAWAMTGGGQ